jgi:hypothetical protein
LSTRAYRIGPLALELSLPDGALENELDLAWGSFRGVPPGQAVKLSVTLREGSPSGLSRAMPRPVSLPSGESVLAGDGWQARISADGLSVSLEQRSERQPLEATVKILLARALSKSGGMLLHGMAVAHGGGAAVFAATDGSGKTTLAQMAALGGLSVLADGLVAVFPISGEWWAYGTPWNVGAAWGAPLKTVGVLEWGPSPQTEKAAPAVVRAALEKCALLPDDEAATRAALVAAADQALGKVRVVKLAFAPDARVAQELAALCAANAP